MEVRAVIMHAMISNCVAVMMVRSRHTRARASRLPVNVDCVTRAGRSRWSCSCVEPQRLGGAALRSAGARYRREWLRESFAYYTRDAFPPPPLYKRGLG